MKVETPEVKNPVTPPIADRARLDAAVAEAAAERDPEYSYFKEKLVNIHKRAQDAGWQLSSLARVKEEYDEEIRITLGEENYSRYRSFERERKAKRELKRIADHALTSAGRPIDPAEAQRLVQLIAATGSTLIESWDGPYDPLPQPTSGRDQEIF